MNSQMTFVCIVGQHNKWCAKTRTEDMRQEGNVFLTLLLFSCSMQYEYTHRELVTTRSSFLSLKQMEWNSSRCSKSEVSLEKSLELLPLPMKQKSILLQVAVLVVEQAEDDL